MSRTKKYTREGFIEAVKAIHGDAYDYTNTKYSSLGTTVECSCKEHGTFHVHATTLVSPTGGCPKCKRSNKMLSREDLLHRFRTRHGDKFDYSHVADRVKFRDKVTIVCPIHGKFTQEVRVHAGVSKYGCPRCAGHAKSMALRGQNYKDRAAARHSKLAEITSVSIVDAPITNLTWKPTK
jgi:hypothetical protein